MNGIVKLQKNSVFTEGSIINHSISRDISGPSSCELKVPLLMAPRPILIGCAPASARLTITSETVT